MRNNLWDDPRVSRLCEITGQPEAPVVGALYWLWATADEHTEDGHLPGYSLAGIDRKVGVKGFAAAMVEIGWMSETDGGVTIERFGEHNGASAKRRCQEAKRKADSRALTDDTEEVEADPEPVKPKKKRATGFDAAVMPLPSWLDADAWASWVADRNERRKPVTERAAQQQIKQLEGYMQQGHLPEAVIAHSIAGGYQGLFAPRNASQRNGGPALAAVPQPVSKQSALEQRNADTVQRLLQGAGAAA